MTSERWRQIEEVYHAALERDLVVAGPPAAFGTTRSVTMERPTTDSQYRGLRCK